MITRRRNSPFPVLLLLLTLLFMCLWQMKAFIFPPTTTGVSFSNFQRIAASFTSKRKRCSSAMIAAKKTTTNKEHEHYTITYSPNFNRHLVSKKSWNATIIKENAVRSFLFLDEALEEYPNATLEPLDPPFSPKDEDDVQLSRIVAGAGLNESFVYYDDSLKRSEVKRGSPAMNPNNGGTYLYRFLQKFYSTLPTITPAEIHRGTMDKFPRIAFYDAALVHERLFFLLSPLPPKDLLEKLKENTRLESNSRKTSDVDFPLLFYKYGYGAGMTKIQLAQALQSLPQYWLPIYLGDTLNRKPKDVVPYIFYQLNADPSAMKQATEDLDHLLTGSAWADIATIAHGRSSLKLTGDQLLVLLNAFPSLRTCDTQPNWEFYHRGPVREVLLGESLAYLRLRLQLDPVQVYSLIKTHTRLSMYSAKKLKRTLDSLQCEMGLRSNELQKVVLRMPSLLGMSSASVMGRKEFFLEEIGMDPEELKKSFLNFPALLQYNLEDLRQKFQFFAEYLDMSDDLIIKMLVSRPGIWGLSTESNVRPKAYSLMSFLGLSSSELGQVLPRAPALLAMNWGGNLEPKLTFLRNRLDLTPDELRLLFVSSPNVLTYSSHRTVGPIIDMLEQHLSEDEGIKLTAKDVLLRKPNLWKDKKILSQEISEEGFFQRVATDDQNQATSTSAGGTRKGRLNTVLEISKNGTILTEYATVKDAAAAVGKSTPWVYYVIRKGTLYEGKRFSFGGKLKLPDRVELGEFYASRNSTSARGKRNRRYNDKVLEISQNGTILSEHATAKDAAAAVGKSSSWLYKIMGKGILYEGRRFSYASKLKLSNGVGLANANSNLHASAWSLTRRNRTVEAAKKDAPRPKEENQLSIYVSGRVYPTDRDWKARGGRRAGGMAVAMSSASSSLIAALEQVLKQDFVPQLICCKSCQINDNDKGLAALIGYSNLGPSRRRCSLFACFMALRVVTQLCTFIDKQRRTRSSMVGDSCPPIPTQIDIITDSSYVYAFLKDEKKLFEWGSALSLEEFNFTGRGTKWYANTDIIYTISRAYHKLVDPEEGLSSVMNTNVTTSFFLFDNGQATLADALRFREEINSLAIESARLLYESMYSAEVSDEKVLKP